MPPSKRKVVFVAFVLLFIPLTLPMNIRAQEAVLLEQGGGQGGVYDGSGVNFRTASQWQNGVVLRAKRMIRTSGDHAKELITGVPGVSNVANWFTLGIFKKALKPQGPQLKATWLAINCNDKTFNAAGDGSGWKNILDDPIGQAEDIFYSYCNPDVKGVRAYNSLPIANDEVLKAAGDLPASKTDIPSSKSPVDTDSGSKSAPNLNPVKDIMQPKP